MLGKAVSPAIQDMSGLVHQCEICFYWSGIHLFHQIGSAGAWRSCVWLTHGAPLYKECFQTTYLCFNEGERKDVVFSVFPCFTLLVKRKNLTLSSQQTLSPSTVKKEDTELEEFHVQQTKSRFCVSSLLDLSLSSTKRESPQLSERFLPQLADTLILPSSSRNACWLSQVLVSSHHFPLELLK